MHVKVEDMVHNDICFAILENIGSNSTLCSILSLNQILKSDGTHPISTFKN